MAFYLYTVEKSYLIEVYRAINKNKETKRKKYKGFLYCAL